MTYFKMAQNGEIVDVGISCLQIFRGRLLYCGLNDAQVVQNYAQTKLYHDDWLRAVPAGVAYEAAVITVIDEEEFEELKELIDDGETVPVPPEPEPEPTPEPEPEPEPEHRMTVQEMREKILELTSMAAKENIARGTMFILHDKLYMAIDFIPKGAEVIPMRNCVIKDINELNGGN